MKSSKNIAKIPKTMPAIAPVFCKLRAWKIAKFIKCTIKDQFAVTVYDKIHLSIKVNKYVNIRMDQWICSLVNITSHLSWSALAYNQIIIIKVCRHGN